MKTFLRTVRNTLRVLWLLSLILYCAMLFTRPGLEDLSQQNLDQALKVEEPIQTPASMPPLRFPYQGHTYIIEPLANYQLSGLVVTHNSTSGIGDIYHDSTSVDLKDLCLVWGENLDHSVLKDTQFWSEPWSCHTKSRPGKDYIIHGRQLSNNHLIGASERVRKIIRSVGIGDTVTIKGQLIRYWEENSPEFKRTSSLVRTDEGNGACEVIFVTEIHIDAAPFRSWRERYEAAWLFLITMTISILIGFLVLPYLEYRAIGEPKIRR